MRSTRERLSHARRVLRDDRRAKAARVLHVEGREGSEERLGVVRRIEAGLEVAALAVRARIIEEADGHVGIRDVGRVPRKLFGFEPPAYCP